MAKRPSQIAPTQPPQPPRRQIPWQWGTRALGCAGFIYAGVLLIDPGRSSYELIPWIGACMALITSGELLIRERKD